MKTISYKISEHAFLTGFIHEPNEEMGNIDNFPGILVLPG